jgi:hypothetical protein
MELSFEQALTEVWRQALIENAKVVVLGTERYSVRLTPKRRLRQVDFVFDGSEICGLEQNPKFPSPDTITSHAHEGSLTVDESLSPVSSASESAN